MKKKRTHNNRGGKAKRSRRPRNIARKGTLTVLLLSAFLIALAFRIAYFREIRDLPFFRAPVVDSEVYHQWAIDIIRGEGMGRGAFRGVFFMSPGYPLFLALIYLAGGDLLLNAVVAQVLLGIVNLLLIYLLGRRLFDPPASLIALYLGVFCGLLLFYEFLLLLATVYITANLLLFYLLLRWREKRSQLLTAGAGLLLGIASILRPSALLLFPLVSAWMAWILLSPEGRRGWKRKLPKTAAVIAVFALALALPILPVTVANYVNSGGDLNLVTFTGGPSFLVGNSPWSSGSLNVEALRDFGVDIPDPRRMVEAVAAIVDADLGLEATPSMLSSYCYRQSRDFIISSPGRYLRLLARKLKLFFNRREVANNYDFSSFQSQSVVLRVAFVNFGWLLPFALAGMVFAFREWRRYSLLYLFFLQFPIFAILFYVLSRYRLPAYPFLILFAAFGIRELFVFLKKGKGWSFLAGVGVLAAGAYIAGLPLPTRGRPNPYYNLGVAFYTQGRYPEAIEAYRESLRIDPGHYWARFNLGNVFYRLEEWDAALAEYREALSINSDFFEARHNLANVYAMLGRLRSAVEEFERLVEMRPDFPDAYYNLSLIHGRLGEEEKAKEYFRVYWELTEGGERDEAG